MDYQDDLGYRLAVVRNTCEMTQQYVADALGLAGQQAVSEIEKRRHLTDQELEPFAVLFKVSVHYIKTFNINTMGKTIVNVHPNAQSHGNSSYVGTNNFQPTDEILKQAEETKAVLREQIGFLKDMLQSKDANIAKLEARLDKQDALIVEKDEIIKDLLTRLNNTK